MGRVVEAVDLQLGRTVAYKEVLGEAEPAIERRFAREVQITARLEHPAIVPVYDSGLTADGRPFYVMRKITGKPLEELIARMSQIGERLAQLPAVLAAIDAIAHAHRRGVIHRDLKPANILVGELGETIVIDWGLAKVLGEPDEAIVSSQPSDSLHTQLGAVFGTPGFMAPEQARGEVIDPRGDVYALGATLYHLLAGRPPHRGGSATEVMSSTMVKEIDPQALRALGAPPDLIAIVVKAMALEPDGRYPTAAELSADVRRFLAGQLVGAHDYTHRQRLARFARRNRGVLAAIAIALAIGAVLAWYGVSRIVDERDLADAARGAAQHEAQISQQRLLDLQDRDDRRTVANARALVTTNPTATIAMLKQLRAGSKFVAEARAVAQSAVARGVAWGQQTMSALIVQAALSPDATKLFALGNDGYARLWDLETHKLVWQRRDADVEARVVWLDATTLVLRHKTGPPLEIDLTRATATALPIASMRDAVAASGVMIYTDAAGAVHRFEIAGMRDAVLPVPPTAHPRLSIAPDASAFGITEDATRATVYRADGSEVAHRDGAFYALVFSRTGRAAALGAPDVAELTIATAAWVTVPLPGAPKYTIARADYAADQLVIAVSGRVYAWRDGLSDRGDTGDELFGGFVVAGGVAITQVSDARLHWANAYESGEIALPMTVTQMRLVAQPDRARLVVVGAGVVLDLSVDSFVAHPIAKARDEVPFFVGDDTLLYVPSGGDTLRWHTLSTGADVIAQLPHPGVHVVKSIDPASGRVLISDMFGPVDAARMDAGMTRLIVATRGESTARVIAEGLGLWGVLLEGGAAAVYSDGGGRLFAWEEGKPVRQLGPLDGEVASIVERGARGWAAYTDKGELSRGSLDSARIEHIYGKKTGQARLGSDVDGRIYVAIGSVLSRWDADLHELADLKRPIASLLRAAGNLVVELDGGEYVGLPLAPDGPPVRLLGAGSTNASVGDSGHLMIAFGQNNALSMIELPARLTWTQPARMRHGGSVTLSPHGRTLVYEPDLGSTYSLLRTLSPGPTDLAAWLDELTNATADEQGLIVWPWQ